MKKLLLLLLLAVVCTSCYTTRTSIGDYRIATKADKASSYTYSKGKQCYLFWGLIPLGRTHVSVPRDGHCEVRTSVNFFDGFLSLITGGIFAMQTIKVKAPMQSHMPPPPPGHRGHHGHSKYPDDQTPVPPAPRY